MDIGIIPDGAAIPDDIHHLLDDESEVVAAAFFKNCFIRKRRNAKWEQLRKRTV